VVLFDEPLLIVRVQTKGNTPKYGLIYHSSFIGRTGTKNKGRISRFLANKCSIASRIDNFTEAPTTAFGEALKRQVEERIAFYADGVAPTKNEVAMVCSTPPIFLLPNRSLTPPQKQALDASLADINIDDPTALAPEDAVMADGVTSLATEQVLRLKKKEKKEKKHKKHDSDDAVSEKKKKRKHDDAEVEGEKKKKKKKNKGE
jgi:nucleolar protein 56